MIVLYWDLKHFYIFCVSLVNSLKLLYFVKFLNDGLNGINSRLDQKELRTSPMFSLDVEIISFVFIRYGMFQN